MHILKFIAIILEDIIISFYLSLLLYSKNILTTPLQIAFVFLYFLFVLFIIIKFLQKYSKCVVISLKKIVIGIVISFILTGFCYNQFKISIYKDNQVKITATGEMSERSLGNEVWITSIVLDDNPIDLATISLTDNWFLKDGLLVNSPGQSEQDLIIQLPQAKQIEIDFVKHPWSGIVQIDSGHGSIEKFDLYDEKGSSLKYQITGNMSTSVLLNILNLIAIFIGLFNIFYFSAIFYKKNLLCNIIISLIYSIMLFNLPQTSWISSEIKVVLALVHGFAFAKIKKRNYNTYNKIWIGLTVLVSTFMFFGSQIFLLSKESIIVKLLLYGLFFIWMIPIINLLMSIFERIESLLEKQTTVNSTINFHKFIAIIVAAVISGICIITFVQMFSYKTTPSKVYIKASGEKNIKSQGYEVLIGGILVDGKSLSVSDLTKLPEGWNDINGMVVGNGGHEICLKFEAEKDIKIIFNKHKWSGIVNIKDGNQEVKIDLYSDKSTSYVSVYQVNGNRIYNITIQKVLKLCLFYILIFIIIYYIEYLIYIIWNNKKSKKYFFILTFLIYLCCLIPFIIASYPAALSLDSISQLTQVKGWQPITDAHPAIHTLLIKLIVSLTGGIHGMVIFQALCLSSLGAIILTYLYSQGINRRLLLIFAFIIPLSVNNGIYCTTIWKDIPYSYCILWLTFVVYRMQKDDNYIKKVRNIIVVVLSLSGVYLFRHNGFILFILVISYMILLSITKRTLQYIISIAGSLLIIILIRGPVYKIAGVEKIQNVMENSASSAPLLHGLVYANLEGTLPLDTQRMLDDIMLKDEWSSCFNTYSANELYNSSIAVSNGVSNKITLLGTQELLNHYIKSIPTAFWQLMQDRLHGVDLLWNVFRDNGYNWRTANDTYEIGIVSNELSLFRVENLLTNWIKPIVQLTIDNPVLDSIFWRAGIWLFLLFNLLIYLTINKKYRLIIIMLPCIGNTISLFLGMAWQDYRYVYYLGLCMPFILLLSLSNNTIKSSINVRKNR